MSTKQQLEIKAGLSKTLSTARRSNATTSAAGSRPALDRRINKNSLILNVSRIRRDEDQVRSMQRESDNRRVQELAASIEEVGLQQPPGVRLCDDGMYEVIYGEGRFTAVTQVLKWSEVPVIVVDAADNEIFWMQLHENIHRTDLHPLDLAAAITKAQAEGNTIDQIADRMKKSKTWVQKAMTVSKGLTDSARDILAGTEQGRSMETAYAVATVPQDQQADIAKEIVEKKLTQREVLRVTSDAKKSIAETPAVRSKGGRRGRARPFEMSIRTASGATVCVRFRKSQVTDGELAAALEQALESVQTSSGSRAA